MLEQARQNLGKCQPQMADALDARVRARPGAGAHVFAGYLGGALRYGRCWPAGMIVPFRFVGSSILALAVACGGSNRPGAGGECENALTLRRADHHAEHALRGGCTSLIVNLEKDAVGAWAATPTVRPPELLRFDYRADEGESVSYYFTPMRSGTAAVEIDQDGPNAWAADVRIEGLP